MQGDRPNGGRRMRSMKNQWPRPRMLAGRAVRRSLLVGAWLVCPAGVTAQTQPGPAAARVDASVALMSDFPDALNDGCRKYAASTALRANYQVHRWLAVEAGLGVQLSLVDRNITDCGGFIFPIPPGSSIVATSYTGNRGNSAVVPDARLVLTPTHNAGSSLRLIGGVGWYLGRGTPAWLVGAGLRVRTTNSAVILDVERWNAGIPLETRRITGVANGPDLVEPIGTSRSWFSFFQYRVGFSVWIR